MEDRFRAVKVRGRSTAGRVRVLKKRRHQLSGCRQLRGVRLQTKSARDAYLTPAYGPVSGRLNKVNAVIARHERLDDSLPQ